MSIPTVNTSFPMMNTILLGMKYALNNLLDVKSIE